MEVAGLVIASFPVIVHALNHLAEGLESFQIWRRYRRELERYARNIENQRIWYLDTIEELLDGIARSDEELHSLVSNPGGPSWQSPEYQERLEARLDRSYHAYTKTIDHLLSALQDIRMKLGIDDAGKVQWVDLSSFSREIKRVRFVLSRSVYDKVLEQIVQANQDLRGFTHQSRQLEPARRRRHSRRGPSYRLLKHQATSLHSIIHRGTLWDCQCQRHHGARLRLEPRLEVIGTRFRLCLTNNTSTKGKARQSWQLQEIEIEPIQAPDVQQPTPVVDHVASNFGGKSQKRLSRTSVAGKFSKLSLSVRKRVKFAIETPPSKPTLPFVDRYPDCKLASIKDLCGRICREEYGEEGLDLICDNGQEIQRHVVYFPSEAWDAGTQLRTLDQLFSPSEQQSADINLSRRDRLYIAMTLASSVLQLDGTPWLSKFWKTSHVLVPYPSEPVITTTSSAIHPYITCESPNATSSSASSDSSCISESHLIHNEVLFALGLVLMQLSFGKNLSDLRKNTDVRRDDLSTDIMTAKRLLDHVYVESGAKYGDAVRRCLHCPFDVRDFSLDNDQFRDAVFNSIVTPLVEDFNVFSGELT